MSTERNDPFPARLRETRKLRELEQAELSALCSIPATSISHFEAGRRKPNVMNLRNLAEALKVSIDYLLGRTDNPEAHIDAAAYRDKHLLSDSDRELIENIKDILENRANKS